MRRAKVPPAAGQRWAYNDPRYGDYRYLTVTAVDDTHVHYRTRRGATKMQLKRFGGSRFTYCGMTGPGILPPFTKEPYVRGECLRDLRPTVLPLTAHLEVGFGLVTVKRDGETVWASGRSTNKRLGHIECRARDTPGDWRINFALPLSEQTYQRQESGWILTSVGMGFA